MMFKKGLFLKNLVSELGCNRIASAIKGRPITHEPTSAAVNISQVAINNNVNFAFERRVFMTLSLFAI
jgi:hypothetical protein